MDKDKNILNLENFFINDSVEISLNNFIYAVILSALLCFVIKKVYIRSSQSLSNKEYFSDLFIPLGIITCLVITVIKFSLALSLGLVGALSIVRFRAAIKEPEELVFLFFAISIGLANGANQFLISIFATLVIVAALFIKKFLLKNKKFKKKEEIDVNVVQISINNKNTSIQKIIDEIKGKVETLKLKSAKIDKEKENYSFIVNFKNADELNKFFEYSKIISNKNVSIELYTGLNVYE